MRAHCRPGSLFAFLPGVQKRSDPIARVGAEACASVDFLREPGLERQAIGLHQQLLVRPMTVPAIRQDRLNECAQLRFETLIRDADICQSHRFGFSSRISPTREHHLPCLIRSDSTRQSLAQPPDRHERPFRVRICKARRLRRNDQIARERQLERPCVAMSVHGRDHWLRQSGKSFDHLGLEIRCR